ncbi:unnamed protein product [Rotaria sp. Silwood2]|nr:unnamed protein product [Rotaria sp. Silwood2]CAF4060820.1 unnamed protein product [Rotaria sp. Silwood2]
MLQLRCWNHAIQDLKLGAKKHFNIKEEVNAVQDIVVQDVVAQANKKETLANAIDTITNLLRATSRTDFFIEYENISISWPKKFCEYFEKYFLPKVDELDE